MFHVGQKRCMVVVDEKTGETCGKLAVESARLPLDPHGDDEAGRERRMVDVRFCRDHWAQRQQFASNGRVQWFRVPEGEKEND
ncbi:MAG TPA: hypothetical protein VLY23_05425 [Candidatus Acidoferrum sp.]|nr:hypothetical protein [Candidatus Acidoferrum sp.]